MNIATSLNKKYIDYTIVMLTSLCVNNPVHIDAYVMHSELTDDDFTYMREMLSLYDISLFPLCVDEKLFDARLPRNEMWSIETYYRLLLLDLLPVCVDRLFYLDVDLIINKSLEEFYDVSFEEDEIIACVDACGLPWPQRTEKQKEMFAPMIEQGYQYFNAGVMLLNIDRMRGLYDFAVYQRAIEEWNYEMSAPDQDILNYVHWKNVGYVNFEEFDLFARAAHNKGVTYADVKNYVTIIHYAGDKPWNNSSVHFDIEWLWWDYARLTPCYHKLIDEFMIDVFQNENIEMYIQGLIDSQKRLAGQIQELNEVNQKLISILKREN